MTTDRAAALAAKLTAKQIAEKIRFLLMNHSILNLSAYERLLALFEAANEVEALEASCPAQDIVAEMREKVEALEIVDDVTDRTIGFEICKKEVLAILSPTKNTAPTEAEES